VMINRMPQPAWVAFVADKRRHWFHLMSYVTSTIFLDVMAVESQNPPARNILVIWEGTHDINANTMRALWL
jgi:hypothetical protein